MATVASGPLDFDLRSPRQQAIASLRSLMEAGTLREGDRLPAEERLAEQFGVSRMTLRSAMGVLEREGLIRRERNVGCFAARPAGMLQSTSLMSHTIVLLSNHMPATDTQLFDGKSASVVSGVMDGVGRRGKNILSVDAAQCSDQWIGDLIAAKPSGVILSCWEPHPPVRWQFETMKRLQNAGVTAVTWGDASVMADFDRVSSDHISGTEQLTHALARAGRKRILRLWTPGREAPWIRSHDLGYERAVAKLGLENIPAVNVEGLAYREPDHQEKDFWIRTRHFAGYLAEHLRGENSVDAIMVGTDCEAINVLAACRLFGRTDIAVTGYDNYWRTLHERRWEPTEPFATVDKSNHRLGFEMVNLLLARAAGELPDGPQHRLIEQQIIVTSEQSTVVGR